MRHTWHIIEPGVPFVDNWHIRLVCEYLEKNYRGEIRKIIFNQPPGTSKSTIISVLYMCWVWIKDPGHRFFAASYDGSLTLRDARRCLDVLRHEYFQARWGDRVVLDDSNVAAGEFYTKGPDGRKGQRLSRSVGGPVTGKHLDTHVYDDPHKPLTISKVTLDAAKNWYQGTASSRFRKLADARVVVVMQRLHDDDLSGYLEKEHNFFVVRLPMRFEPENATPGDPRVEPGELLNPKRIPESAVRELEKAMGSIVAAAQLQQRPVPDGGEIFQRQWFRFYKAPPARFDQIIQSWDCAFKDENSGGSYVVGQVWGRKGAEYYLLDQVRNRMGFPATCHAIKAMASKWKKAIKKLIEDKANGPSIQAQLKKTVPGIVMVDPQGGKVARANAVSPLFEAGNVYLPDPEICPWVGDYMAELQAFPRGSADDQVDATSQALAHMVSRSNNVAAAIAKMSAGEFFFN